MFFFLFVIDWVVGVCLGMGMGMGNFMCDYHVCMCNYLLSLLHLHVQLDFLCDVR
jgi:hypothetical protein